MSKFKVTYPDGSDATVDFDGKSSTLFEQMFSHVADEVKEKCKVVKLKDPAPTTEGK